MVKSITLIWGGTVLGSIAAFCLQILLARNLEVEQFGTFTTVLTFISLVAPLAGFGVSSFWLRIFGEEGWRGVRWFRVSLNFVFLSTFLVLVFLYGWAVLVTHDVVTVNVFYLLSILVVGQVAVELVSAKFQLEERYSTLAFWQLLPHFLRLVLALLVLEVFEKNYYLIAFSGVYAAVSLFFLFAGFVSLRAMGRGRFLLKGHLLPSRTVNNYSDLRLGLLFSKVWPFGIAGVLHLIYFQSNVVILNYLDGSESAGFYGVAFVVISAVYILPSVVYQKFLMPKIHRWASKDLGKLKSVYSSGNFWMALLGIGSLVFLIIVCPYAIPFFFGEKYSSAILIINILALAVPMRFVAANIGAMLTTQNNMRRKVLCMAAVAVFSVAANFFLINIWGAAGAAFANVLSEFLLLVLYFYTVKKFVFKELVE